MTRPFVVVLGWPRGSTLHNAVLLSLALHVGIVIAALTVPGLRGRPEMPLPTLDVVLVSPLGEPAPVEPVQAPAPPAPKPPQPEPEPAKPPEGPSVTAEDPPEKPIEKPKPAPEPVDPEPVPEPINEPEPPPPAPQPATPSPAEGDPDPLANQAPEEPQGPISGGTTALAGMGTEFNWYRDSVIRALYTSWRQPFAAGLREPLVVTIAFDINRDGSVSGVRIEQPSGNSALDRSAFRAVLEAQLPPLPRNHGRNPQPAAFVFQLDPRTR